MPGEQGGLPGLVSELLGFISSLFGTTGLDVWGGVSGVGDQSFSSLNNAFGAIREVAGKIKGVFDSIWKGVIVAMLRHLLDAYQKLRELLSRIFAPIIRWMERLRKLYDSYFNQFVKPVLNIIRKLRQFLQVFKLLGFKWAARLDSDLARIEGKIAALYTQLRSYLNIATSWIQLIVDPTGILRRNPLFASIIRSAPELRNLMDQVTVHPQTQQEVDKSNKHNGWFLGPTSDADKAAMQQRQLSPYLLEQQKSVQAAFDALPGLANQSLA